MPDRMLFSCGERIRGQTDHDMAAGSGCHECTPQQELVPDVEGIECPADHDFHCGSIDRIQGKKVWYAGSSDKTGWWKAGADPPHSKS